MFFLKGFCGPDFHVSPLDGLIFATATLVLNILSLGFRFQSQCPGSIFIF